MSYSKVKQSQNISNDINLYNRSFVFDISYSIWKSIQFTTSQTMVEEIWTIHWGDIDTFVKQGEFEFQLEYFSLFLIGIGSTGGVFCLIFFLSPFLSYSSVAPVE